MELPATPGAVSDIVYIAIRSFKLSTAAIAAAPKNVPKLDNY